MRADDRNAVMPEYAENSEFATYFVFEDRIYELGKVQYNVDTHNTVSIQGMPFCEATGVDDLSGYALSGWRRDDDAITVDLVPVGGGEVGPVWQHAGWHVLCCRPPLSFAGAHPAQVQARRHRGQRAAAAAPWPQEHEEAQGAEEQQEGASSKAACVPHPSLRQHFPCPQAPTPPKPKHDDSEEEPVRTHAPPQHLQRSTTLSNPCVLLR